jgi:hypothetical protein
MHGRCPDSTACLLHSITGPMNRDEVFKVARTGITSSDIGGDLEIDPSRASTGK